MAEASHGLPAKTLVIHIDIDRVCLEFTIDDRIPDADAQIGLATEWLEMMQVMVDIGHSRVSE